MKNAQFNYSENHFMNYYEIGEGPTLLFLHGWGSSAQVMFDLAKSLSGIRRCIIPDLPGFGHSPEPPTSWAVEDYLKVVYRFVQEELATTNFDILAHSFGGRIMLKWLSAADDFQIKPTKVLLTGAAGLKPKRKWNYYYRKYLAKSLKAPFVLLPEPIRSKSLARLRKTAIWKSLGSSDYQQLSGIMRETFVKTVNEYLDNTLPKIEKEVFLLWGEMDDATPMDQAKRLEKGIQNAVLVTIPNAGHYAFLDKGAEFKAISKAFFDG